jgi:hypothetical protein
MRFASRENTLLGQPEVGVGVHPGGGGAERLPHLVGRGRALEIILGANDFDGDTYLKRLHRQAGDRAWPGLFHAGSVGEADSVARCSGAALGEVSRSCEGAGRTARRSGVSVPAQGRPVPS